MGTIGNDEVPSQLALPDTFLNAVVFRVDDMRQRNLEDFVDFAVPRNGFELVRNDADYGRHPEPRNRDVVRDRADDVDATSLEADLLPGFPQGSFNRAGVEILDFPPPETKSGQDGVSSLHGVW